MMSELFRNMLNASAQGSIVIAAVILLRPVLKRAPRKYICLLWILAGIRLLMPFSLESSLSLQPRQEMVTESQWQQLQQFGTVLPEHAPMELPREEIPVVMPQEPAELPENSTVTEALPREEPEVEFRVNWAAVLPGLWLAGAGGMALYGVISYVLLKRRLREAIRLEDGTWETDRIGTAFILGYFRPRIYLPMGMGEDQRALILKHEQTHLKRLDHWTKLIGFLALAVHWFNPLVWIAYWMLCQEIELACDEAVVAGMDLPQRKCYSAALLTFSTKGHLACPVAFGEKPVKRRIKAVLNYRKPAFWLTLCAIAAIAFVAVSLLTVPKVEDPEAGGNTQPQTLWKDTAVENLYRELERIRNSEEIALDIYTSIVSDYEFFQGHEQTWWISGDDWYRTMEFDTEQGTYREEYLQTGGKQYARREAANIPKLGNLEWTQLPDGQVQPLFLLAQEWKNYEVLEVRKEESTDGGVVTVVFQGNMEETPKKTYYEHTHEFHLDENGRLVGMVEYSFVDQYINQLGTEGRFHSKGWSHVTFRQIKPGAADAVIQTAVEELRAVLENE